MERKLKHLEFIQSIITRLSQNSFIIKGWALALVSAILAYLATEEVSKRLCFVSLIPVIVFWVLDGYFLWQENLFKALYNKVASKEESQIDFLMNTTSFRSWKRSWLSAIFSPTLIIFYLSMVGSFLILIFLILFPSI